MLTGYDIVADVGAFTGVMKSFTVTADSSLDIGTERGSGESQDQRDRDSRGPRQHAAELDQRHSTIAPSEA